MDQDFYLHLLGEISKVSGLPKEFLQSPISDEKSKEIFNGIIKSSMITRSAPRAPYKIQKFTGVLDHPKNKTPEGVEIMRKEKLLQLAKSSVTIENPLQSIPTKVTRIINTNLNRIINAGMIDIKNKLAYTISITRIQYSDSNASIKNISLPMSSEVLEKLKNQKLPKDVNISSYELLPPAIFMYLYEIDPDGFRKLTSNPDRVIDAISKCKRGIRDLDRSLNDNYNEINKLFSPSMIYNSFSFKKLGNKNTFLVCLVDRDSSDLELKCLTGSVKSPDEMDSLKIYFIGEEKEKYYKNFCNYVENLDFFVRITHRKYWDKKESEERKQAIKRGRQTKTFNFNYMIEDSKGEYIIKSNSDEKTFQSVIIDKGIKSGLKNEIKKFIKNKPIYKKFGISYNLGIMLYGEPGTGKSTIAKAIVNVIENIDDSLTYTLYPDISKKDWIDKLTKEIAGLKNGPDVSRQLDIDGDYNDDASSMYPLVSGLSRGRVNNSATIIIILEDIDIILGANRKDEKTIEDRQRLSNLLRLLDGQIITQNCIFIATTNRYSELEDAFDEALTRDGRFDVKCYIGNFDRKMASKMCKYFDTKLEDVENFTEINYPIKPAHLQNLIMKYILDFYSKKPEQTIELGKESVILEEGEYNGDEEKEV